MENGKLYTMGQNDYYQLGDGTINDSDSLIPINLAPIEVLNRRLTPYSNFATQISSRKLTYSDDYSDASHIRYIIESNVREGSLRRRGILLQRYSSFTQADINNGLITYTKANNNAYSDGFKFKVIDEENKAVRRRSFHISLRTLTIRPPFVYPIIRQNLQF